MSITVVFLIACVDQRIQRKGILVGRGDGFFNQATDQPGFVKVKVHFHGSVWSFWVGGGE
jgi:hypothetical protein